MIQKIVDYLTELFPDPRCELDYTKDYELLIAVMLSAQTTDKAVNKVTAILFDRYPTIEALAKANLDDIVEIIRPIGTQQKKAANIISITSALSRDYDGVVPNNRTYLESLSGIGHKSANVVLSVLFNENCLAVDTHVSRVSIRLGLATKKDSVLTIEKKVSTKFKDYSLHELHHRLVLFGRYHCTAKNPKCEECELKTYCSGKKL